MNDIQRKMAFQLLKPFLTPETLRSGAIFFIDWVKEFQNQIILNEENGEKQIAALFYTSEGKDMFSVLIFDENNIPVRTFFSIELNEAIELLIKKI